MTTTEVEKRYRIHGDISSFLDQLEFQNSKRILDEYFDTQDGKHYRDGIFIRRRNNKSLDIKFNPDHLGNTQINHHITCSEYIFPLPDGLNNFDTFAKLTELIGIKQPTQTLFESFLIENELIPLVILDKNRSTYTNDHFIICVDSFTDFGTFIEFESKDENISTDYFEQMVEELTKDLQVQAFNSGYVELALQKINPTLYVQGKYLIHEMSA